MRQRHQDKAQFMKWNIQIGIVQDHQIRIDLPLSIRHNINNIYILYFIIKGKYFIIVNSSDYLLSLR